MKREWNAGSLAALFALILAAFVAPPGRAAEARDSIVTLQIRNADQEAERVLAYWTEERMRQAKPRPLPVTARTRAQAPREPGPLAEMATLALSGLPGEAPAEVKIPQSALQGVPVDRAGSPPFLFTRYAVFPDLSHLLFPYVTVGKLFHTVPGLGDFFCSATSINSANRSVVWTAGHCIGTFGVFDTNHVFVPGRVNGLNPFGHWTPIAIMTTDQWFNGFLAEYDYGALVMRRGGKRNRCIGDAVGYMGFLANGPREEHWHIMGYPVTPPFDGETNQICAAAWGADDQPTGGPGDPMTRAAGCDQTVGLSGGPWVVNFGGKSGQSNLVSGNLSYKYPDEGPILYTPYYGDVAVALRNAAQSVHVPGCSHP